MRSLLIPILCALLGCDGGKSGDGLTVSGLVVGGCGAENGRMEAPDSSYDSGEPETLDVTAAGPGAIAVSHQNVTDTCCLDHEVSTAVSGTTLTITYPSSGEPCDCICQYDYDFTVSGLAAGTWTVEAGDSTATVTVE